MFPDSFVIARTFRKILGVKNLGVNPDDEHFFIIGSVEDTDSTALGQATGRAPEKIMLEFLLTRRLEAEDLTALRIDSRHDVLDRSILTCRVHPLQYQQHRLAGGSVMQLLPSTQAVHMLLENRLVFGFGLE